MPLLNYMKIRIKIDAFVKVKKPFSLGGGELGRE